MSPKVSFRSRNNTLRVRIKVNGHDPSIFDTGVECPTDKFDARKQICGIAKTQEYMQTVRDQIKGLFVPGISPHDIWNKFLQTNRSAKTHTLRDAFEYYINTAKVRPSTLNNKVTLLAQLAKKGYDQKPIADLNGAAVRSFLSQLNVSESSEFAFYTRLNTVLDYYIKDHDLGLTVRKGLIKQPSRKSDDDAYLSWEELKMLLTTNVETEDDQKWANFFCFMCLTGMAVGDALQFNPSTHINGNFILYNRQKTGVQCTVPLFDVTKAVISKIEWPLRYTTRTVQNKCAGLISKLVGRKIKTHGGRKTFGAICLEMGYSIESIAKFMGHSNPMITSQIYAKVTLAKIEREMRELPESAKTMMNFKI
ncbi:MAG: tyrosine-type recombinase/integrase [Pseudomonadota bacterium]|jgi:integrase